MTNPYPEHSVAHRDYAAGFACGVGNAAANFTGNNPNWSAAYRKGYGDGQVWGRRG